MRLAAAARYFDRTVCADAYDPSATFRAQLNLFDDSMRDGTTVVRRILSVDEAVEMPARRTITVHDEYFIVGASHVDSFDGSVVRRKFVVHRCDGVANVRTFDQALRVLSGTDLYAGRLWVKDLKELETSSKLSTLANIYVAPTEDVDTGKLVKLSGRWHLVRNHFIGAAGFNILESDELPEDCLGTATYTARTGNAYNPATDTVSGSASSVPILTHRWQDDYVYLRMSAKRFDDGDLIAHVSKASIATAEAGDSFVLGGVTYNVLSARDDGANAWHLHSRRA